MTLCRHPRLHFMSGDYYVGCPDCHAVWMRKNPTGREYGVDADGNQIGADPSQCQPGFVDWSDRVLVDGELTEAKDEAGR